MHTAVPLLSRHNTSRSPRRVTPTGLRRFNFELSKIGYH